MLGHSVLTDAVETAQRIGGSDHKRRTCMMHPKHSRIDLSMTLARIAVGTYEGRLFGWDVNPAVISTETEVVKATAGMLSVHLEYAFGAHEGPVRCVAIDGFGKFFVTGGADETIRCDILDPALLGARDGCMDAAQDLQLEAETGGGRVVGAH